MSNDYYNEYDNTNQERLNLSDAVFDEDGVSEPVKMLLGVRYEGVVHDTFTFREITGEDEEAISKSEIRANNAKVIHVLLERCVKSIGTLTRKDIGTKAWSELIRSIYVGDQDFMLMVIRAASLGKELKVSHICPNKDCGAKLTTYVDVNELSIRHFKGYEEIPFELMKGWKDTRKNKNDLVHKEGVIRLAKGIDREILTPLYKKNPGVARTMMLTRLVTFISEDAPPVNDQIMKSLTTGDRKILTDLLTENEFGIDGSIDITCSTCGEDFKGDLQGASFLS